jgi:nitroreductase
MATDPIQMLRGVRQTRDFQDRPVPAELLREVLEVGRWSGSSRNSQPWEFVVVDDPATLRQLAEIVPYGKFLAGAALGIALVMHGTGSGQSLDAGRVAERMMIAAHARGLGAGLATLQGGEAERRALDLLGVPAGHSLGVTLAFGYPAPKDPSAPKRPGAGRRPLGEVVHYARFGSRAPRAGG